MNLMGLHLLSGLEFECGVATTHLLIASCGRSATSICLIARHTTCVEPVVVAEPRLQVLHILPVVKLALILRLLDE